MKLPDFIIIGAVKGGTTSLFEYIGQHPAIYASAVKEIGYFLVEGGKPRYSGPRDQEWYTVTEWSKYLDFFKEAGAGCLAGEASPEYMLEPQVPERIKTRLPNVKLIVILRDPAKRAFSHYNHNSMLGFEPISDFREAMAAETTRAEAGWGPFCKYRVSGFYFEQLSRFYEHVPANQIKIYLYEDLSEQPLELLADLFSFLGIDETFQPDMSIRYAGSGAWKSQTVWQLVQQPSLLKAVYRTVVPPQTRKRLTNWLINKNIRRMSLDPEIRADLIKDYREDILRLQDHLGRDLSAWLKV